jgi:glycosyltransferase involved in cell wall biosynthesis
VILGINAYHGDVSAVLLRDGELVAAVEKEAMAAGCPVIVGDRVDLAPDVRAARAGLVTPPTAEETAEALRMLLTEEALGEELGRNGQALVRARFTWERVAGELTAVYEDVLTGRRHSPAWRAGQVTGQ